MSRTIQGCFLHVKGFSCFFHVQAKIFCAQVRACYLVDCALQHGAPGTVRGRPVRAKWENGRVLGAFVGKRVHLSPILPGQVGKRVFRPKSGTPRANPARRHGNGRQRAGNGRRHGGPQAAMDLGRRPPPRAPVGRRLWNQEVGRRRRRHSGAARHGARHGSSVATRKPAGRWRGVSGVLADDDGAGGHRRREHWLLGHPGVLPFQAVQLTGEGAQLVVQLGARLRHG